MNTRLLTLALLFFSFYTIGHSTEPSDSIWSQPWHASSNEALQTMLNSSSLSFKGGLELKSNPSILLGGLSALSANEDGSEILMISDYSSQKGTKEQYRSTWYTCQLSFDGNNSISKLTVLKQGQMFHADQTLVNGEIESVATIKKLLFVSFDNTHGLGNTIAIYPKKKKSDTNPNWLASEEQLSIPNFAAGFREGIECMTETLNKELFLIHETKPGIKENTTRFGWIIDPKSHDAKPFLFVAHLKEIKGATTLPNGNIVVIEKSFNAGTQSTHLNLVEIKRTDIYKNTLSGKVILNAKSTLLDNFEGITSFERDGKVYILLVSDNNGDWNTNSKQMPKQKTLVLLFEYK